MVFRDTFGGATTTLGTVSLAPTGTAALTVAPRAVGAHTIIARFLGSTNDAASPWSPSITQQVDKGTASLAISIAPLTVAPGGSAAITVAATAIAPATGIPTGSFSVDDGATQVRTGTLSATTGTRTITFTPLASLGTHSITVVTAGDASFGGATSVAVVVTVARSATVTALAIAPTNSAYGTTVTLTATIGVAAGAPAHGARSGVVVFTIDGVASEPVALSSNAAKLALQAPTAGTATGSHAVTASYRGDASYLPSASATKTYTVS